LRDKGEPEGDEGGVAGVTTSTPFPFGMTAQEAQEWRVHNAFDTTINCLNAHTALNGALWTGLKVLVHTKVGSRGGSKQVYGPEAASAELNTVAGGINYRRKKRHRAPKNALPSVKLKRRVPQARSRFVQSYTY